MSPASSASGSTPYMVLVPSPSSRSSMTPSGDAWSVPARSAKAAACTRS